MIGRTAVLAPGSKAAATSYAELFDAHRLTHDCANPRGLNLVRGAYWRDLGNTPGHVNHWSKRGFVSLLSRIGAVEEARSPFPWTMLLVRL